MLTTGLQEFAKMALSYIGAMFCSVTNMLLIRWKVIHMIVQNFAIQFTSYPTQVLVKSCKMVPVMLVNMVRGVKCKCRNVLG